MTQPERDALGQHIFTEVPEADAAEQATPAVPDEDTLEAATATPPAPNEADPADAWEQALEVPDLEEDYDYRPPEP